MKLLEDKVALVSGGTQGVGAAVARAAVREGAAVAVTGRRPEPGEKLVAELEALGFRWPDAYNLAEVGAWLAGGHSHDLELNAATARRHLSTDDLPLRLGAVLRDTGLRLPPRPGTGVSPGR